MYCTACGKEIAEDAKFCKFCGQQVINSTLQPAQSGAQQTPETTNPVVTASSAAPTPVPTPVLVNQQAASIPAAQQMPVVQTAQQMPPAGQQTRVIIENSGSSQTNGLGIAGFVLALIGLFVSWVPILGWGIWFLGVLLSFIGLFGKPKGFAIAGFIISFADLIILLTIIGGCAAIVGMTA